MVAVIQPKTRLKPIPSSQTLTDVIGWTENSAIHADQPCAAGKSGNASAMIAQIIKITISAAESAHPRATILSGLLIFEFIASSKTRPTVELEKNYNL